LAPDWIYFFWTLLFLVSMSIAFSIVNLFRPYWTKMRATCRLLANALGSIIFCWLFKTQLLAGIEGPALAGAKGHELTVQINAWVGRLFPYAVVVAVIVLGVDIYRITRVRGSSHTAS
jgi:hypothetical protein